MIRPLLLPALLFAATLTSQAKPEWTYSFDSLKPGKLSEQDGWKLYRPSDGTNELPPLVVRSEDDAHGLVLAQQPFDGQATSRGRKIIPAIYDGGSTLTLEFDARSTAAQSIAAFGFGSSGAFPATFGIQFDQFILREENFGGTTYAAVDLNGKRISPVRGDWYRVRSVWHKDSASGEWTADLAVRNLSKAETKFTQLYFDRQQKASSMPLNIDPKRPAKEFNNVVIRLGVPGGEIDNLSIKP